MKEQAIQLTKIRPLWPFLGLYACIGLAELSSFFYPESLKWVHFVAKPLIMLSLLGFFLHFQTSPGQKSKNLVLGAISFSFLGDVFLMFEGQQYFLLGLGSFLVAQISYLLLFRLDTQKKSHSGSSKHKWFSIPIILYGILLLTSLWPQLGEMQIPVLVYAVVITGMGLAALDRYGAVGEASYWAVLLGAFLFIISDSLIALSRFGQELVEIPYAGFWIMLTYILAQFLIIRGWMEGNIPAKASEILA